MPEISDRVGTGAAIPLVPSYVGTWLQVDGLRTHIQHPQESASGRRSTVRIK